MGGSYNNWDVEGTLLVQIFETIIAKQKYQSLAKRMGDSIYFGLDHNNNNNLAIHF